MTEDQIRDLLRDMRDEPIPPDSRRRVRVAATERIRAGSRVSMFHSRWTIATVLLATASIAVVLLLLRPSGAVHEPIPPIAPRQRDARLERVAPLEKTKPQPISVRRRGKHQAHRTV